MYRDCGIRKAPTKWGGGAIVENSRRNTLAWLVTILNSGHFRMPKKKKSHTRTKDRSIQRLQIFTVPHEFARGGAHVDAFTTARLRFANLNATFGHQRHEERSVTGGSQNSHHPSSNGGGGAHVQSTLQTLPPLRIETLASRFRGSKLHLKGPQGGGGHKLTMDTRKAGNRKARWQWAIPRSLWRPNIR